MSSTDIKQGAPQEATGRLFFLDLGVGRIVSVNPDGSDLKVLIEGQRHPDGLAVDPVERHLYWTIMGNPNVNDGCIMRADLEGKNITVIVPQGGTFTPKQMQIDLTFRKLYWCDREGMRVMRCNLDGSGLETLVQTGNGDADRHDQTRWCVGIAVDSEGGHIYWTQKGGDNAGVGRIFRASLQMLTGETPDTRTDIELLFKDLPEPIDLDLDLRTKTLYWTDRGDPPRGNSISRASVATSHPAQGEPEIVVTHLMEGIGLTLDPSGERMFATDLGGSVYRADLDGKNLRMLLPVMGNLAGITYAEVTATP